MYQKQRTSLFFTLLVSASVLFSCAVIPQSDQAESLDEYGTVTLEPVTIRGWEPQWYSIRATSLVDETVDFLLSYDNISISLKLGDWTLTIIAKDSAMNEIYSGFKEVTILENPQSIMVPLLQLAGDVRIKIEEPAGYSVPEGFPGHLTKVRVTAEREGFEPVYRETNNFESTLFFSRLCTGPWSFRVEGLANNVDPDSYNPVPGYSVYLENSFLHEVVTSRLVDATFDLDTQVLTTPVQFSATSGTYSVPLDLSLTCDTAGATIYYSTDGSEPGEPYSSAIHIADGEKITIKARAETPGLRDSITGSRVYGINVPIGTTTTTSTTTSSTTTTTTTVSTTTTTTTTVAVTGLTLYLKQPAGWDTPWIHYWGTGDGTSIYPGAELVHIADNWWLYTFTTALSVNCYFHDNNGNRTPDLFRMLDDGWYFTDGTWYDTRPD
jgi:hypothetical protein